MNRRHLLLAGAAGAFGFSSALPGFTVPARAASPAETFVSENIQRGFDILNDRALSAADRKTRFADFIVGLTDVKRVALFLLGRYASTATPADTDAYVAAYQAYVQSVYQSYFALYSGQSLRVIDSRMRAANDFVVRTSVTGGNSAPLEVDFRVRTDGAKPVLVDMAVAGVWLALAQRDQFTSVLARSNGDVKSLTAHLRDRAKLYR